MFIVNTDILDKNTLYACNYHVANFLTKNGFSIMSIENNIYYFLKTKELLSFIKNGGENNFA